MKLAMKKIISMVSGNTMNSLGKEGVVNSQIQHKELVSSNAEINSCTISGNVTIGDFCRIYDASIIAHAPVTIGKNTSIFGPNTDIYNLHNEVQIGNFCSIARHVSMQEYNHIHDRITSYFIFRNVFKEKSIVKDTSSKGKIEIGNDVWIGTHSVILSGVTIGDGAVIASNSVVSENIPPYAIAAGSPAKTIKYRFSEDIIQELLKLKWWLWDHDRIKRNRNLFEGTLTIEKIKDIK